MKDGLEEKKLQMRRTKFVKEKVEKQKQEKEEKIARQKSEQEEKQKRDLEQKQRQEKEKDALTRIENAKKLRINMKKTTGR